MTSLQDSANRLQKKKITWELTKMQSLDCVEGDDFINLCVNRQRAQIVHDNVGGILERARLTNS